VTGARPTRSVFWTLQLAGFTLQSLLAMGSVNRQGNIADRQSRGWNGKGTPSLDRATLHHQTIKTVTAEESITDGDRSLTFIHVW